MANLMAGIPLDHTPLQSGDSTWKAMRHARREDAQSLVELALVVPLFLLLLLGSAEFARFAWAAVLTSNAARAGAAFGAVNPVNAANTAGIQDAATKDSSVLSLQPPTVTSPCACSDGTSIPDCTQSLTVCKVPATIINYVQVNTSSTVTPLMHYPGLPTSFTVTGKSIMVVAP
jgi:Flp pilus assembly protein TadG